MKLDELRKIADEITVRMDWICDGKSSDTDKYNVTNLDFTPIAEFVCEEDARFCIMAANNIEKLLDIAEAAKLSVININDDGINAGVYRHLGNGDTAIDGENWKKLNKALEALEKE